jgi:hypothetical protein
VKLYSGPLSPATLGAPPAAALTQLGAWLSRMAQRPAVRSETLAMSRFAAAARAGGG